MTSLFAIGMPGPMELLIILAIMLLLFGGARLPGLMRNLGRSAKEFQKGVHGMDEEEDYEEKRDADKQVADKQVADKQVADKQVADKHE